MISSYNNKACLRIYRSLVWIPLLLGANTSYALFIADRYSRHQETVSPYSYRRSSLISRYALPSSDIQHTVVDRADQINKPKYGSQMVKPTEISYHSIVQSAYLRHILLETNEMSEYIYKMLYNSTAMAEYLVAYQSSSSKSETNEQSHAKEHHHHQSLLSYTNKEEAEVVTDPFGHLASQISLCEKSKWEGGLIGWVDNPFYQPSHDEIPRNTYITDHPLFPKEAIQTLFLGQPKGGDVVTVNSTRGVHLLLIEDVLVQFRQGGQNEVIKTRSKFGGKGTLAATPSFVTAGKDRNEIIAPEKKVAETFHVLTNGCQMNVADSERMEGILSNSLHLSPSSSAKDANVVVINTCSIRDHAESKLYDQLGPLAQRKRNGEALALVVTGCVAQQEGKALLRKFPEVDAVLGPQYVNRLGDILQDVSQGHQVVATDPTLIMEDISRPVRSSTVRAWVNVIYGCNEHCTYCVVPYTRGIEQSRSLEAIAAEVLDLASKGYKEVTLLGQNIDAYGRDMTPKKTFADLLQYLNHAVEHTGMERIRYVTSHPRYFSDRVIDIVANIDNKICECFHVPFQSGDDSILKHMRRGYTFDSYMKIIDKIKTRAPDASICGDVIVGFPGETESAFQRTLDLMEAVKFDNLNTFAYSPRPNTEASKWSNQIPDEVKQERLQIVQRLASQHAAERSSRYLNKMVEVLVEERNPKNINQVMGRTRQGRLVFFDGLIDDLMGKLVNVEIKETRPWSLSGIMRNVIR